MYVITTERRSTTIFYNLKEGEYSLRKYELSAHIEIKRALDGSVSLVWNKDCLTMLNLIAEDIKFEEVMERLPLREITLMECVGRLLILISKEGAYVN